MTLERHMPHTVISRLAGALLALARLKSEAARWTAVAEKAGLRPQ
jgi:hypothetical protein